MSVSPRSARCSSPSRRPAPPTASSTPSIPLRSTIPSGGCCRPRSPPPATTPAPLDGRWGPGSQAALEAWAAREFGGEAENAAAAALVLVFLDEVTRAGWDFQPLDGYGVSLALPFRRLGPPEAEEGGERRWSRDGSLTVLTHRFDAAGARAWHDAAARADAGTGPADRRREAGPMITAGVLRDGRHFFTRSDATPGAGAPSTSRAAPTTPPR